MKTNTLLDRLSPGVETDRLSQWLKGRRVFVLTGAGISTESGIPDYRGPVTRLKPRRPIQHRDFVTQPKARARYWARSALGWPRFRAFEPNPSHTALARLEAEGRVHALVTQNVDRLHTKAGSRRVLELHGSLYQVRCLACGSSESRDGLQARLLAANPGAAAWSYELAPDGDADLPPEAVDGFVVPPCLRCGGVLKPDVVFFGDNVPPPRVAEAFEWLGACDAVLVVGSSLHVWSGYRFVRAAAEANKPVAILNLGETRGDVHAALKLDVRAGDVLPCV
ncbi:MAG: NAD-dependent protein deacetylase [Myxococcaceae bacterium]|nr:NAD-dependent protein deacetylase [Myxococcaceae bacterium]